MGRKTVCLAEYLEDFSWISPAQHPPSRESLTALPERYGTANTDQYPITDAGCGSGDLTEALTATYPDTAVTGTDIDRSALQTAYDRLKDRENADIVCGDGARAFRPNSTAFLYAVNMLQAVPDPEEMFEGFTDTLASGGYMAVTVPTNEDLFHITAAEQTATATITEDGDDTVIETPSSRTVITDQDAYQQISSTFTPEDLSSTVSAVRAEQRVFDPDWVPEISEQYGMEVTATEELACSPEGLPALLDLFGFDGVRDDARALRDAYLEDPASVEDALPSVKLYVIANKEGT